MRRVETIADLRAAVGEARRGGARIGFVPTMGALHAGHLSLVEQCHDHADLVVVSIFVNPAQFGPGEDLDAYPRDLEGDEARLRGLGDRAPDLVFAPPVEEVYPRARLTTVHVDALGERLCGASRPGHFDGVTTVVAKLFNLVQPDVAVFGRKDFQQLAIVRRMVADLDIPVEVVGGRTVREDDGVAMSSRNRYLVGEDRVAARVLSRALRAAVLEARGGAQGHGEGARAGNAAGRPPDPAAVLAAARRTLDGEPRATVDYVEVLDPEELTPVAGPRPLDQPKEPAGGEADGKPSTGRPIGKHGEGARLLVAIAAHVGPARLIDNVVIGDVDDEDALLARTGT